MEEGVLKILEHKDDKLTELICFSRTPSATPDLLKSLFQKVTDGNVWEGSEEP